MFFIEYIPCYNLGQCTYWIEAEMVPPRRSSKATMFPWTSVCGIPRDSRTSGHPVNKTTAAVLTCVFCHPNLLDSLVLVPLASSWLTILLVPMVRLYLFNQFFKIICQIILYCNFIYTFAQMHNIEKVL